MATLPPPVPAPKLYNARQAIDLCMLTLLLGREAGNQSDATMFAVGSSVSNRVKSKWRGKVGWEAVIEDHWQYSSIYGPQTDPNLLKYPNLDVEPWERCLAIAEMIYNGMPAMAEIFGATHYYDCSLDPSVNRPDRRPRWAIDGSMVKTADIESFHFYRLAVVNVRA